MERPLPSLSRVASLEASKNRSDHLAVATVGGSGQSGVSPGPLPASFNGPLGLLVLASGDLLIADVRENVILRLRGS
jgi:hypothetical protein